MNPFNWWRALEGAAVAALVSSLSLFEVPHATDNLKNIGAAFIVTFACATIKGFGQAYQAANTITTQVVQPINSTSVTETVTTTDKGA